MALVTTPAVLKSPSMLQHFQMVATLVIRVAKQEALKLQASRQANGSLANSSSGRNWLLVVSYSLATACKGQVTNSNTKSALILFRNVSAYCTLQLAGCWEPQCKCITSTNNFGLPSEVQMFKTWVVMQCATGGAVQAAVDGSRPMHSM